MPSTPSPVVTTGAPSANASRTFTFIPLPATGAYSITFV
jgi:hypothetical protein